MPTKPARLSYGDAVGIVAPASAPPDPATIDRAAAAIEHLGFRPVIASHARARWGFLAGSDRQRADDLMQMFEDRRIRAIVCVRGGYGTARLLDLLDYRLISRSRKIFVGYSDITSLHCAFLLKADLVSFHGPMLNSDFVKAQMPQATLDSFLRTLMRPEPAQSICAGFSRKRIRVLSPGIASGPLVGGNLSILCASVGTPYQPSCKNAILFLEDVDEVPYRFDRMLTQLLHAGLLQQVGGIAVGINAKCRDPKARNAPEYRQTVEEVLSERLLPLGVPVVIGLPFGHVPHNATLPIGINAKLDAYKGDLVLTESAVS